MLYYTCNIHVYYTCISLHVYFSVYLCILILVHKYYNIHMILTYTVCLQSLLKSIVADISKHELAEPFLYPVDQT